MDAEQEEYSEEKKNVGVFCNSEECQDIGQKTMVCLCFLLLYYSEKVDKLLPFGFKGMDAEQEEYSEEEKDIGVSCNSQECEDIGQSRQVCLCALYLFTFQER